MKTIELKVGDTFHFPIGKMTEVVQGVKQPVDLNGVTFTSQVRDNSGIKIADCVIEVVDAAAGTIRLLPVQTSNWPLKELFWDIQTERDDIIASSKTLTIKMVNEITK